MSSNIARRASAYSRRYATRLWIAGLGVLLVLAIRRLSPALNPPSLYVDDVWVAMLVRGHFVSDWLHVHAPTPLGYLLIAALVLVVPGFCVR